MKNPDASSEKETQNEALNDILRSKVWDFLKSCDVISRKVCMGEKFALEIVKDKFERFRIQIIQRKKYNMNSIVKPRARTHFFNQLS